MVISGTGFPKRSPEGETGLSRYFKGRGAPNTWWAHNRQKSNCAPGIAIQVIHFRSGGIALPSGKGSELGREQKMEAADLRWCQRSSHFGVSSIDILHFYLFLFTLLERLFGFVLLTSLLRNNVSAVFPASLHLFIFSVTKGRWREGTKAERGIGLGNGAKFLLWASFRTFRENSSSVRVPGHSLL